MTEVGQAIFGAYSLITITALAVINIRKIAKDDAKGWELVVLIPVLIFLTNVI
ncbi:hypothetical protein [Clostridium botulinum]|uniref:hypothetical protein n=1 Tax=Clostridium botulinum TaxID=1491 RepID=UPI000A8B1BBC|nr:hypothetical protein [Clostridium botulinum]MCD3204026.1 hypothetical protein [Clostridium botulinum C/D]MCD3222278.1 hypothetical protein [Clostridium botulinum C/D]MCD3232073.1 hypothetical protein [Clostridium botulinum C/D]MCD3273051.1 hypothetical protein [Clostridium botulinum C/D]MCD3296980.1 hypothetical protein [Clostridium botulinum C/D]